MGANGEGGSDRSERTPSGEHELWKADDAAYY